MTALPRWIIVEDLDERYLLAELRTSLDLIVEYRALPLRFEQLASARKILLRYYEESEAEC